MACAGGDRGGPVHGRARHRDRQRRAAVDQGRPALRPGNLQWVISAYAILFGGALLLGGRLADIFGRRRLFMIGLAIFSGSSLLCGLSWSEGSLIALPRAPGTGRRAARARRAVDAHDDVRGGRRAKPRARYLGRGFGQRRRRRRAAGRVSDLISGLVVGVLHQRPRRHRRDRRDAVRPVREPRAARPPALRFRRRNLGDRRRDAAGVRDDAGHPGGWGECRRRCRCSEPRRP